MEQQAQQDDDTLDSLAVVIPLAVTGFVIAAGCWTLFAVAGVHLRTELALSDLQFGVLLAMPMAVSALLAIPAGLAAQRYGARSIMLWCLSGLAVCMALLLGVSSFYGYLIVAGGLGLAGGFYSAGLQFVVSHCDVKRLGLVLGVFGAGVTGAGFTYYLVPLFHNAFAWQGVPLAYLIVILLVIALLLMLTDPDVLSDDRATDISLARVVTLLRRGRSFHLSVYFGVVAGSFFALALWLPDFLSAQFQLQLDAGARMAQWFVIPGALAQISGGALSDRFGSSWVASRSLALCLLALAMLSYPPMTLFIRGVETTIIIEFALPLAVERSFIVVLGVAMGCAMGSLQRMVILANRGEAALFAGLLLVIACSIAFVLPVLFGAVNQWLGVRTAVFMILFVLLSASLIMFARDARRQERKRLLYPGIRAQYP
ncbi:MFS transporter [Marinobacter halophilus]|uniref:MFS transporter n=1 Tax=Marinobacter halophilus TaxID=1323740 RepID=A0A2T1KE69_9GAMM|nr:MFS transporter [Marinobacter halophilus]PSF08417.1 MFS transporter [Marinobacter halophilus]GGC60384.1 nitrite extrusion protein 1 [Marinobacter halophilus]